LEYRVFVPSRWAVKDLVCVCPGVVTQRRSRQSPSILAGRCRDRIRAAGEFRGRLRFGLGRSPLVVRVAGETDLVGGSIVL
jgi:hypothetical protein